MAEAVLGLFMNNLDTLIRQGFGLLWGVQEDMVELSEMLSTIRDVLEDAETKQITYKPIANWLNNLKQAAYDADDVLDEWCTDARPAEALEGASYTISKKAGESVSSSSSLKKKKQFKEIITTFNEIAAEKNEFFLSQNVVSDRVQFEETSSDLVEEVMYGRDGDREKVVDIMLNNVNRQENVSVLPIQGMGGLGKTALAKLVFHDERVVKHFNARIWVCVGDDFDVKRLTKMILETYSGQTCDLKDLDPMQRQLQEKLSGKKFLLVLDDIWNEDSDKWERLKSSLTCGVKGSWVIVTTRLITVTDILGTVPPHMLTFLSEEDCWCLFERRAFGAGNEKTVEFVKIGKQIVRKCGGLPLAVKALGGLMKGNYQKMWWSHVRDSQFWDLPQDGEGRILPALILSYNHLPSYMRQCFLFCSVFPKDHEINKEELVHLWMANGFVQPEGRMELEDAGNLIFSELLRRSFFQDVEKDEYGNVYKCKMHDLMHDLACSVSVKECCIMEVGKGIKLLPGGVRHMSLVLNWEDNVGFNFESVIKSNPQLRTLLLLGNDLAYLVSIPKRRKKFSMCFGSPDPISKARKKFAMCFGSPNSTPNPDHLSLRTRILNLSMDSYTVQFSSILRVLDLRWNKIEIVPPSVCELIHLRYLDLSHNLLTFLPESIHMLRNLQMLDLKHNPLLTNLSLSTCELEQLRYLNISYCEGITSLPQSVHGLKNLRSLDLSGNGLITKIPHSIGRLEHLRYLNLSKCNGITSLPESISRLGNLHVLILRECEHLKSFPENMRNMSSLRQLDIRKCYKSSKLPIRMGELMVFQTLNRFHVGRPLHGDNGDDASNLQRLDQLEGGLEISGLENISNGEDAKQVNLMIEKYLSSLSLNWGPDDDSLQVNNSKEVLAGIQLPPGLYELGIWNYKWETSFPEGFLANHELLRSVEIHACSKLTSLPREMENLKSLRSLKISTCRELVSLPKGLLQQLSSLEIFEIDWCRSLKSLGLVGIPGELNASTSSSSHLQTSLQILRIFRCSELVLSEDDFQYFNALRLLRLHDLHELSPGIQHLPMLRHLDIGYCWNLRMLPEWIKNLTALHTLEITYCHKDLCERCKKDKGEDWHLISHIPDFSMISY